MIDRIQFGTGAAAGAAGSATATGYSDTPARGRVLAVHVAYLDSPPATTDVTLSDEGDPAGESVISLVNANTDAKLYPRRVLETNDGTDLSYDGSHQVYGPYVIHGRLQATIAQANAGDSATITVWLER